MDATDLLRSIPQVDAVLREPGLQVARSLLGDRVAEWLARSQIERVRAEAKRGVAPPDAPAIAGTVALQAQTLFDRRLRRVINATGVVLHTNLGRAQLSDAAREAVIAAAGATNVEFDIERGERSGRAPMAATLAAALAGAAAALVVNNNAASLLLILAALAKGREVIVSRGEMIEIGGEFRLPSIMEASGAILRETGTTNRTHARDYRAALSERTAMILIVHPSNYRVEGFTATPSLPDLSAIAREADVPLVYDTGSGLLWPHTLLPNEPDAQSSLRDGADLVCFSGDKLLGGPQAGIITGRIDLIERLRRHPIARAVRADKLTLAALEETLLAHARREELPVARMIAAPVDSLRARASAIAARIPNATVVDGSAVAGGGSAPEEQLPSVLIRIGHADPAVLASALRGEDPPVVTRFEDRSLVVDLRTVHPDDDEIIASALKRAHS